MSLPAAPQRLLRLVRKEVTSILRDRRTIITLFLMPVLLYPLLAIAFQQMLLSSQVEEARPTYRLGFASRRDGEELWRYWRKSLGEVAARHPGPKPQWDDPYDTPDPEAAVRHGGIDVAVRLHRPKDRRERPRCEFIYREDSVAGREAVRLLETVCAEANVAALPQFLTVESVKVQVTALPDPGDKKSHIIPVLVPLILILMTITGAVYPAIDLTAGERERGTLEVLVAAPVPRMALLFAKYVAVWVVATLTALINLTAMTVTLLAFPAQVREMVFGQVGLTPVLVVQVLGLLLLFAAFFSAVLLAITSFARSFKEAQSYLVPLMLVSISPGVVALLPGLPLDGPLVVVPLLNIVLLARDLFEGTARLTPAVVVIATTLLYALAAIGLSARIFGSESVLYSEQGSWGDLFRRPRQPRPQATMSGALLCLALMFPVLFLVNGYLTQQSEMSLAGRLLLAALANVLLFGGFPLVAGLVGRLQWRRAFRLQRPGVLAWVAAGVLGLSLWALVHELVVWQETLGVTAIPEMHKVMAQKLVEKMRLESPALILATLAVLPAVLEELLFRGYLFSALARIARPWLVVVGSAVLFAVFHLLMGNRLAIERFLPSLLMGLVLGWLAWKSGSVLPGILLHLLHNSTVILLGYYHPQLEDVPWLVEGEGGHLPAPLLAGAAVVALAGLALLWLLPSPKESTAQR